MIFELLACAFFASSLALAYPVTRSVPLSPSISAEMAKTNSNARIDISVPFTSNNETGSKSCYLVYSPHQPLVDNSTNSLFRLDSDISPFYLLNSEGFESTYINDFNEWLKIRFDYSLTQDKETLKYTKSFSFVVDSVNSSSNSSWNFFLAISRSHTNNVFAYFNAGSHFLNDYNLISQGSTTSDTAPTSLSSFLFFVLTFAKYSVSSDLAYSQGYSTAKDEWYQKGKVDGEKIGYEKGKADGANDNFANDALISLFDSVLSAPVKIIQNSLNFELFGVNFASLAFGVITIAMIVFVISFFVGKGKS